MLVKFKTLLKEAQTAEQSLTESLYVVLAQARTQPENGSNSRQAYSGHIFTGKFWLGSHSPPKQSLGVCYRS